MSRHVLSIQTLHGHSDTAGQIRVVGGEYWVLGVGYYVVGGECWVLGAGCCVLGGEW